MTKNQISHQSKLKNQSGFSLMSVMMASGIMGIVLVGSMQLLQSQMQAISFLEDKLSKNDIETIFLSKLKDPAACANSFSGLPVLNKQAITKIKEKDNSIAYQTGKKKLNSIEKLTIANMELVNVSLANAPHELGEMKLFVHPVRQRKGGGPQELSPIEIFLSMETDATSMITACQARVTGSSDGSCSSLPSGISSPVAASYKEGFTVASTDKDFICINNAWTSLDRNPSSDPNTTESTTPPGPCTGQWIWVHPGKWHCKDGR